MAKKVGNAKTYLVIAVLIIVFLPSFAKYQELRYKNNKLEERIRALDSENKRMAEEKRRLETDITYVEQRARETMGMARKGEIVMRGTPEKK